jgi:hypothetical protein
MKDSLPIVVFSKKQEPQVEENKEDEERSWKSAI